MERALVCMVEDDGKLARLVDEYLSKQGYSVFQVGHGDRASALVAERNPDIVVLDVMLPGIDGYSVCRQLRGHYQGPIIFLTARDSDSDQLMAFDAGADDFVSKPVNPAVLLARVRALLRRPAPNHSRVVQAGPLRIDGNARRLLIDDQPVAMTTAEFDLLWFLAERVGKVVTRDTLHTALRGVAYDGLDRSIDLRVSRIRKKLGDDQAEPRWIKTIRGRGYILVPGP